MTCEHKRAKWTLDFRSGTCSDCGIELGEPRVPVVSVSRLQVIEECAQTVLAAARRLIDRANDPKTALGTRNQLLLLADAYGAAANEVRRLDPEHRAKEEELRDKIKAAQLQSKR